MSTGTVQPTMPRTAAQCLASSGFASWLEEEDISLCLSAYLGARLLFVSADRGGVRVDQQPFGPCMGLALIDDTLLVGAPHGIWRLHRETGGTFRPRHFWRTGDVKVHDLAGDESGQPMFVNTRCNCVARPRAGGGFVPLWQPPFLTAPIGEDCCHLNGLAADAGRLRYATCVAASSEPDGWRSRTLNGGLVMDVSGDHRIEGLCFPHSPRIHHGQLWLHDSGSGRFGRGDIARGRFEPIAFCPGFLRGLSFHRHWAVAGLSDRRMLSGRGERRATLPLDDELDRRRCDSRCGVHVIDTGRGEVVHTLLLPDLSELYDVRVLPGVRRPALRLQ